MNYTGLIYIIIYIIATTFSINFLWNELAIFFDFKQINISTSFAFSLIIIVLYIHYAMILVLRKIIKQEAETEENEI